MRKAMVVVALVAAFMTATVYPVAAESVPDVRTPLQEHGNRQVAEPQPSPIYVVRPGDTLSERFPQRWRYVCAVNVANHVIPSCDVIRPGDRLDRLVTPAERAAIDRWMDALPEPEPMRVNAAPAQAASEPEREAPATNYGSGSGCDYAIPCPIVMCESGGSYDAENPTSTASGAYQITDGTWNGYGGYSHASDAPPAVQDERASQIWAGGAGRSNWVC